MKILVAVAAVFLGLNCPHVDGCRPSVTEVGGSHGSRNKRICSGDLIFSESFNNLNENIWNHEHQVDGCGVS